MIQISQKTHLHCLECPVCYHSTILAWHCIYCMHMIVTLPLPHPHSSLPHHMTRLQLHGQVVNVTDNVTFQF